MQVQINYIFKKIYQTGRKLCLTWERNIYFLFTYFYLEYIDWLKAI